jgi:hypothetical protein
LVLALLIPLVSLCRAHTKHRTPPPPPPSTPAPSCSPWAAHPSSPRTTTTPWEASPHLTDAPKPPPMAGPSPELPRRRSPPRRQAPTAVEPLPPPFLRPIRPPQQLPLILLQLLGPSLATLLAGKPLADELLSAAASVAVGTSPPVTPSSSQAHPWMRHELLVPVGQPFSTPNADPRRNLAGNSSAPSSPTSQGLICDDFKSFKGLAARFQSLPPQFRTCELQKYVDNCRKFRKIPNQFCLNP